MFDLPWLDHAFDVTVSFNGIWGGCDEALAEMARVTRPGGSVAFTFWGDASRLDILGYFLTLASAETEVTSRRGPNGHYLSRILRLVLSRKRRSAGVSD